MKAETRTLQTVLHGDRRFMVPVYQRPYVWERERQWEPLWDDVEATAVRLAEARIDADAKGFDAAAADKSAPPHFLGAVVIEGQSFQIGDVDTRLVVDGQQRLTTLQLLFRGVLDAFEDISAKSQLTARIRKAIQNDPEVVSPQELLKLVPRRAEQADFTIAMSNLRPTSEDSKFAAARAFFRVSAAAFLEDNEVPIDPFAGAVGPESRASLLAATLLGLVKLVVIDLEDVDDAQVIFEALNARNTPLSATDLVKNLLFLRAQAQHHDPDDLYEQLWKRFDDAGDWWLTAVGVGHAQRARQDWLLGDWLIAELGRTINVGRLYGEFRKWMDDSETKPFDALLTLNQYADAYEALNGRRDGATERELLAFSRIERLGITAAMPVMLWLLVQPSDVLNIDERERAIAALESFVVRRMLAKSQTRGYALVFVDVLKRAQSVKSHAGDAVIAALRDAPSGYQWPSEDAIRDSFETQRYYGPGGINRDRLLMVLGAVDDQLQRESPKSEPVTIDYGALQVEHVIPKSWQQHWPVKIEDSAARAVAEQEREQHVNRIGNLTLATGSLNNGMNNTPWAAKKADLQTHSKLCLNALLIEEDDWDETRIRARGIWLGRRVDLLWPGPASTSWDASIAE